MAPDLRRKVDAARAARLAREAEMKKQVEAQVSCSAEELPTFVLFSLFSPALSFLLHGFWKSTPCISPYNSIIPPFEAEAEARHGFRSTFACGRCQIRQRGPVCHPIYERLFTGGSPAVTCSPLHCSFHTARGLRSLVTSFFYPSVIGVYCELTVCLIELLTCLLLTLSADCCRYGQSRDCETDMGSRQAVWDQVIGGTTWPTMDVQHHSKISNTYTVENGKIGLTRHPDQAWVQH
jgi:hypothetical protein